MKEQLFLEAVGELDTALVAEYLTERERLRSKSRLSARASVGVWAAAGLLAVCSAILTLVGILLSRQSEGMIPMEARAVAPWLFLAGGLCLLGAVVLWTAGMRRLKRQKQSRRHK